ncbi:MAG TPA: alpha-amylase family glycosyl hydrolase [Bacteroidota bacterium]|nr:alpha-amylase family glycosyl hydrolase [Bacteroidota bacterium]
MAKKGSPINLRTIAHPVLYEVNARVLIRELSDSSKDPVTLGTIPNALLDEWASLGIHAVWMMGVWSSGPEGIAIARSDESLRSVYASVLPGYRESDVAGSPYAIYAYEVSKHMGGEKGLKQLRTRLAERGIGLVLDFVPNHTARDHPWVKAHPEYYVQGHAGEEMERPDLFFPLKSKSGTLAIAMGRDPSYAGWTDTAQLNVGNRAARKALIDTLQDVSRLSDGVRCDMAMLVLKGVFEKTWSERSAVSGGSQAEGEFWDEAIKKVRSEFPNFLFIAEAYWNMEWDLQQLGFDYTYDKTLVDRLKHEGAGSVRDHLRAEMDYQKRSLRFIENHDEQRAARAFSSDPWLYTAATVIATIPGMVMFHEGQFEGRTLKLPVQLARRPAEDVSKRTKAFYERLLSIISAPVFQQGEWRLLMPRSAWHENYTWQDFLIFWWHSRSSGTRMIVVNYAPHNSQCYVDVPMDDIEGPMLEFRDLLGDAAYTRDKNGLSSRGMYFDLSAYGMHILEVASPKKQ